MTSCNNAPIAAKTAFANVQTVNNSMISTLLPGTLRKISQTNIVLAKNALENRERFAFIDNSSILYFG